MYKNVLGERIRAERIKRNWSQQDVAEQLAASLDVAKAWGGKHELFPNPETVGRWERGVQIPSRYYRKLLCSVFEITEVEIAALLRENFEFKRT